MDISKELENLSTMELLYELNESVKKACAELLGKRSDITAIHPLVSDAVKNILPDGLKYSVWSIDYRVDYSAIEIFQLEPTGFAEYKNGDRPIKRHGKWVSSPTYIVQAEIMADTVGECIRKAVRKHKRIQLTELVEHMEKTKATLVEQARVIEELKREIKSI